MIGYILSIAIGIGTLFLVFKGLATLHSAHDKRHIENCQARLNACKQNRATQFECFKYLEEIQCK